MGSPTSPSIAKIFMQDLESRMNLIPSFNLIKGLFRYVDDYLGRWTGSREQLIILVDKINQLDPDLKFSIEIESDFLITYLDAKVFNDNGNLKFSMYSKECAANIVLPGNAFHDIGTKRALIQGEVARISKISDFPEDDIKQLETKLGNNKYGNAMIRPNITASIRKEVKKKQNNSGDSREIDKFTEANNLISLKYMGNSSTKIKNKLRNLNVKLVSKKQRNMESLLARNYKYNTDNDNGVVYRIFCECDASYIGETSFNLEKRIKEHKRDILHRSTSNGISFHCMETGHSVNWIRSQVLLKVPLEGRRKLSEALCIQKLKPEMNLSSGMKLKGKWDWDFIK